MIGYTFRYWQSLWRERKKTKQRSSKWREVRDNFLSLHPKCAACGAIKKLQVHHIVPFHKHPELELDERNMLTLCMTRRCEGHLRIGHGDCFEAWNPYVVAHAHRVRNDPSTRREVEQTARNCRLR